MSDGFFSWSVNDTQLCWSRLEPGQIGQLIHRGPDFPAAIQAELDVFGTIWEYVDVTTPTPHVGIGMKSKV